MRHVLCLGKPCHGEIDAGADGSALPVAPALLSGVGVVVDPVVGPVEVVPEGVGEGSGVLVVADVGVPGALVLGADGSVEAAPGEAVGLWPVLGDAVGVASALPLEEEPADSTRTARISRSNCVS